MKKKLLMYFTMFILIFSLASCSNNKSSSDEKQNTTSEEVTAPSGMSDNLYDAQFSIGGVIYQLPMKCSDFDTNIFISEYDYEKMLYSEAKSGVIWNYGDIRLSGMAINPSINGIPLKDCYVTILDINNSKNNVTDIFFAKGIQLNVSSEKDIINAYGKPTKTSEYNDDLYMHYETYENLDNPIFFIVDTKTDTLTAVRLQTREIPPSDYLTHSDIPYIADYIAPTEFSDNLDCSIFRLKENYYSLPCPVSELLNNGFKIYDLMSYKDIIIPAGKSQECAFELDGKRLYTNVTNFSYYATPVENCYVTSIEDISFHNKDTWAIEISPGLKLGDSENNLLSVLDNWEYGTSSGISSEGKETTYYYYTKSDYQDDWYYTRRFDIDVTEGKITFISVINNMHPAYGE